MKYNETQKARVHVLEHELPCNRLTKKEVESGGTWEEELGLVSWWNSRSVSSSAEPQRAGQPGGTKEWKVGDKVEDGCGL